MLVQHSISLVGGDSAYTPSVHAYLTFPSLHLHRTTHSQEPNTVHNPVCS